MTINLNTSKIDWNLNEIVVEEQDGYPLIPAGTIVKVVTDIKQGGHCGGYVTQGKNGDTYYLSFALVVLEGQYASRYIFDMIGLQGKKVNEKGEDAWATMGKAKIKAMLASIHNISVSDVSNKFTLNDYSQLNGKTCHIKVGIQEGKGDYPAKNIVKKYIATSVLNISEESVDDTFQDDEIPF